MKVLIIGTSFHEYVIAKTLQKSRHNIDVKVIGTREIPGLDGVEVVAMDSDTVNNYIKDKDIDIVIIRPEEEISFHLRGAYIFYIGPSLYERIHYYHHEIGKEFILFSFTDGRHVIHAPPVKRDYGSFVSGDLWLPEQDVTTAQDINTRLLLESPNYTGFLHNRFIKTDGGTELVGCNLIGESAIINVLELLETDLVDLLNAVQQQKLDQLDVRWSEDTMITSFITCTEHTLPFSANIISTNSPLAVVWGRGENMKSATVRHQALLEMVGGECERLTVVQRV